MNSLHLKNTILTLKFKPFIYMISGQASRKKRGAGCWTQSSASEGFSRRSQDCNCQHGRQEAEGRSKDSTSSKFLQFFRRLMVRSLVHLTKNRKIINILFHRLSSDLICYLKLSLILPNTPPEAHIKNYIIEHLNFTKHCCFIIFYFHTSMGFTLLIWGLIAAPTQQKILAISASSPSSKQFYPCGRTTSVYSSPGVSRWSFWSELTAKNKVESQFIST